MPKSNYNFGQADLYNIGRDGWYSCSLRLDVFATLKSKYTDEFIAQNLAEVNAADRLPDETSRYAPTKNRRVDLIDTNNEVLNCFDLLRGYIDDALQFTLAFLLSQARGTKAAGISGKVTIGDTKTTLSDVKISILSLDESTVTDKNGRYNLSSIAAGFYTLQAEREGYETAIIENYEVAIGRVGRLNIALQPVVVAAVVEEQTATV